MREVVITGAGVVSPIGIGIEAFTAALWAGRSGVVALDSFPETGSPFHLGAPVPDFDGRNFVQPRKSLKVMSREIQIAYATADLAMQHAGLAKGMVDPDRFGVVVGSEMLYGEMDELEGAFRHSLRDGTFDFALWGKQAFVDIFPLWMLKYLPNMAACHIGIAHDARGPNNSITLGEVSSLLALIEGTSYIQRDLADVVLVGGSGSRLSATARPFRTWSEVSRFQGPPAEAIRPFDLHRDGLVQGEGAATLVLESREHAERRGAHLRARIAGSASRSEPAMREALTGLALRNAITATLSSARMAPTAVGHVNAHGDGTRHGDRLEAQAIRATLGDVPVTAPKSYFGFLGAGTGMVELVASLVALEAGRIPPTLNYRMADPDCPLRVVHGEPWEAQAPSALKLNYSPTGQAVAVLLDAPWRS